MKYTKKKGLKEAILILLNKSVSAIEIAERLECNISTVYYYKTPNKRCKNLETRRIRRYKLRDFVWRYKTFVGCARCGYNKHHSALHFDHLRDKTKEVSELITSCVSRERVKEEIRKCQVLCANCHSIKTFNDKDYLKRY